MVSRYERDKRREQNNLPKVSHWALTLKTNWGLKRESAFKENLQISTCILTNSKCN